jgi:hypothetical protein
MATDPVDDSEDVDQVHELLDHLADGKVPTESMVPMIKEVRKLDLAVTLVLKKPDVPDPAPKTVSECLTPGFKPGSLLRRSVVAGTRHQPIYS